jgi:hypothetical protein
VARSEVTSVHRTVGVGRTGSNCAMTVDADSRDGQGSASSVSGSARSTRNSAFLANAILSPSSSCAGTARTPGITSIFSNCP